MSVQPCVANSLIFLLIGLQEAQQDFSAVWGEALIATALMPPLCTAGFGIPAGNAHYFLAAISA